MEFLLEEFAATFMSWTELFAVSFPHHKMLQDVGNVITFSSNSPTTYFFKQAPMCN